MTEVRPCVLDALFEDCIRQGRVGDCAGGVKRTYHHGEYAEGSNLGVCVAFGEAEHVLRKNPKEMALLQVVQPPLPRKDP